MISYAIFIFILESSRDYSMIPQISRNFCLHGKENACEFRTFLETFMTMHFKFLDD